MEVRRAFSGLASGLALAVRLVHLWVPKTCATWPDAPLTPGCTVLRCRPGRGMISGLWG